MVKAVTSLGFVRSLVLAIPLIYSGSTTAAFDMLGIELGMPAKKASKILEQNFEGRESYSFVFSSNITQPPFRGEERPQDLVFRDARLIVTFSDVEDGKIEELAIVINDQPSGEVIGVVRYLALASFGITHDDFMRGMTNKYGVPGSNRQMWTGSSVGSTHQAWSSKPSDVQKWSECSAVTKILKIESQHQFNHSNSGWPLWFSDQLSELPFNLFLYSEQIHNFRHMEFQRANSWSYMEAEDRAERIRQHQAELDATNSSCGKVLASSWRKMRPTSEPAERNPAGIVTVTLLDMPAILEISRQRLAEQDAEGIGLPSQDRAPIKF